VATMLKRSTAVGVFEDRSDAVAAIEELRRAGFRDDQIGFIAQQQEQARVLKTADKLDRTPQPEEETEAEEGAAIGAAAGAVVGGLTAVGLAMIPGVGPFLTAGTLASIAFGTVAGAAGGALVGALVGLGIPEEEAIYYSTELRRGRYLVTVNAGDRYDEACSLLQRFRGYDYASRDRVVAAGVR
jgi:hypothetical protein